MKRIYFLLIVVGVLISAATTTNSEQPRPEMYTIDYPTYDEQWKEVEQFERKGLPKSASEVVERIYKQAKQENNSPQIYKTLLHRSKYTLTLEEDAELTIVSDFKSEIEKASFPTKPLLQSALAELYWQYYNVNRYRFLNRTATESTDLKDFRTWDLQKLTDETAQLFEASLENKSQLLQTDLNDFAAILDEEEGSKTFRPSLYDLLAHRALEFYKNDHSSLPKPADQFEITDKEALGSAQKFLRYTPKTTDLTSNKLRALLLFKELLKAHQNETDRTAFVEVDLERLAYVRQHARVAEKDAIYEAALKAILNEPKNGTAAAQAGYYIAALYQEKGETYSPTKPENQWKLKEAVELCNQIIEKYPNSRGAQNCEALKSSITNHKLDIRVEQFVVTNKPALMLVSYKNVGTVYFKATKVSQKELTKMQELYNTELHQYLKELKEDKTWNVKAPNIGDYQNHNFETDLKALEHGIYIITASTSESFDIDDSSLGFGVVQSTNITYASRRNLGFMDFYALDRHSGAPLKSATVKVYTRNNRNQQQKINRTFTTDENGYVKISLPKRYYGLGLIVEHGGEKAIFDNYYYQESYKNKPQRNEQAFVFTDRSIYRPGQTVYFKTVHLESFDGNSELITGKKYNISFRDANYEEISAQQLTSNDYGSTSGSFTIPQGRLTGQYTIQTPHGNASFSVEEYKRPKFEVEFTPIEGNFKLNQKITAKGLAKAYAGSNITDAKVQYRVSRLARFPYWYYSWRRPFPSSESMEIAFGETTTDENGNFEIDFTALPDQSLNPEDLPVFDYQVTADITDINGETRSSFTTIVVGYTSMAASMTIPSPIEKDSDSPLKIVTTNLNGQPVTGSGKVKVFKLKGPDTAQRVRPWGRPDQNIMNDASFKSTFPFIPIENQDYRNWPKGKQVLDNSFQTKAEDGTASLNLSGLNKWKIGWYVAELESKDAFGKTITAQQFFQVTDQDAKQVPDNELLFAQLDKSSYEPGETGILQIGSAATGAWAIVEFEYDDRIALRKYVKLDNEIEEICFEVEEKHRGGVIAHATLVKYNSLKTWSSKINVPYPSTALEMEVSTFRDKLKPGQEETWSFKVKGPKGEKVAAELLASMYDASLDQFRGHGWYMGLYQRDYYSRLGNYSSNAFQTSSFRIENDQNYYPDYAYQDFDQLNRFQFNFGYSGISVRVRGAASGIQVEKSSPVAFEAAPMADMANEEAEVSGALAKASAPEQKRKQEENDKNKADDNQAGAANGLEGVAARKNLQETAFFFPDLTTDEQGNVSFTFTAPEALTKWNLQLIGHTKDLKIGQLSKTAVTQKELMVLPNAPRFFREGDQISFTSKLANLTDKPTSGNAELQLFDALSMERIDTQLGNQQVNQAFELKANGNTNITWNLTIPEDIQAVTYRVVAKAGEFSDGEENAVPVLSNRMLVTETLPMPIRSNQTRTFKLDKLINNNSSTLTNYRLSLEMTSNPAWYAVQSLPYLMEYPYECSEQTFSRFYANSLASHVANSDPKIKRVFDTWRTSQPDALLSNLEKNEELKSLLLRETPWVREAKSESEQKRRVALLFDINKMSREQTKALNQLKQLQLSNGGWPWFAGGRDNRFISQHIVAGLGHLDNLDVKDVRANNSTWNMTKKALQYLDQELTQDLINLKRYDKNWNDGNKKINYTQIHYLYARSFFKDVDVRQNNKEAFDFYKKQLETHWLNNGLYAEGMTALALKRFGNTEIPAKLVKSLDERSITNDELGMYWKENTASWWWYQAPIETQALMVEVFDEVANDQAKVDELKIWLLKNKQTNSWKTTKSTAEAVYALLLRGGEWLAVDELVDITIAGQELDPKKLEEVEIEAGTGYFKTNWTKGEIKPEMGEVTLTKKGEGIAWGALYWQYFEDLDKITPAETPLKLNKKVFLQTNTKSGPKITPVTEGTSLEVGDLLKVRIELRVDRDMEFVHMKDMRAAGFEPINVLSQYKYQDGLGYYESTKDASTDFFFDYLGKGVYVFEYPLRISHKGDFSNGITTIQSMYAPEFTSHSEGIRLEVN